MTTYCPLIVNTSNIVKIVKILQTQSIQKLPIITTSPSLLHISRDKQLRSHSEQCYCDITTLHLYYYS